MISEISTKQKDRGSRTSEDKKKDEDEEKQES